MNTCCETFPATAPVARLSYFSRLQNLVGRARFVSVDLADNFILSMPPNRDVPPLPLAERPESARLMPWRMI